jgi:uncharacterized protein YbjQ (UPF0145 family)
VPEAEKSTYSLYSIGAASTIPVVSVSVLPPNARYQLIDTITFLSTLGTGIFSEFGSDLSNIFGTETTMMNKKIEKSISKCKDQLRLLAHELGANAVIGVEFNFSTNSRDATTVAAHGTAILVQNLDAVFLGSVAAPFKAFNGQADIANDSFQLFLARKYNIERHEVLGKYAIGDQSYETLLQALTKAAELYSEDVSRAEQERILKKALQQTQDHKLNSDFELPPEHSAIMSELGITYDGVKFHLGPYRYDKLEDATDYARKISK